MIGKVIAYGPDRAAAIDGLVAALDGCIVDGVKTNRAFLARLVDHPAFRTGNIDTGFIDRHASDLRRPAPVSEHAIVTAALATAPVMSATPTTFERLGNWRLNQPARRYVDLFQPDGSRIALTITGDTVEGLGAPITATGRFLDDARFVADLDGRRVDAVVVGDDDGIEVRIAGVAHRLTLRAPRTTATEPGGDGRVVAPMPGRVLALDVAVGAAVAVGDRLLVLEAMKMEHRLTAKVAGTVGAVHVAEGDQVGDGMVLVEIGDAAA